MPAGLHVGNGAEIPTYQCQPGSCQPPAGAPLPFPEAHLPYWA